MARLCEELPNLSRYGLKRAIGAGVNFRDGKASLVGFCRRREWRNHDALTRSWSTYHSKSAGFGGLNSEVSLLPATQEVVSSPSGGSS